MQKDLEIVELKDVYGARLTERQREILTSYFDYDLSLSEIAENVGVTRQAVRDVIVRAGEQLRGYENALGIVRGRNETQARLSRALGLMNENELGEAKKVVADLLDYMQEI